jgi:hypothetical protein
VNGPTYPAAAPGVLDRATVRARRDAVHAELLEAMKQVERYRGALALLEDLLTLADPPEGPA